jgi:hypothetical protein
MTSKEKAQELFDKMHWAMPHQSTTNAETYIISKRCALIAVDEILETTKVKWATQRKLPNGEYRLWKGVAYKKYWQEVKKEIEAL